MKKTSMNRVLQTRGWLIGGAAVLLLLSAGGLSLLAQQTTKPTNVVTILLALHLSSWFYVLGIAGLVLVAMLEVIGRLRLPVARHFMSRYSDVEPTRRDFEQREMNAILPLQSDVRSVGPSRLSRQSDDGHKATSSTKVA